MDLLTSMLVFSTLLGCLQMGCTQILGIEELTVCGDAITTGNEVCDDGNLEDGDGCSADCTTITCQVPSIYKTIAAAIESSCNQIEIAPGTYTESLLVNRPLTIIGASQTNTIIRGEGASVIEVRAPLTLRQLTLSGGESDRGGGLRATVNVDLADVIIESNAASIAGGGVFIEGAKLTANNLTIRNNTLTASGAEGGGLFVKSGELVLTDSAINSNRITATMSTETHAGIGMMARDSMVSFTRVTANQNECHIGACYGVGLVSLGGELKLTDVDVVKNSADDSDFAIGVGLRVCAGSLLTYNGGEIRENTAQTVKATAVTYWGAGLFVDDGSAQLRDLHVLDNIVSNQSGNSAGAGIHFRSSVENQGGSLLIENTLIRGNMTQSITGVANGGGIIASTPVNSDLELEVRQSLLSDNLIVGKSALGAGILFTGLAKKISALIINTTISGNRLDGDDGAYGSGVAVSSADVEFRHVTVANNRFENSPTSAGAGIFVFDGLAAFRNSILADNPESDCGSNNATFLEFDSATILKSNVSCSFLGAPRQQDPLIGVLSDNGGPTFTHSLPAASPAVNSGTAQGCRANSTNNDKLTTDQRGFERSDATCDVGAFEL